MDKGMTGSRLLWLVVRYFWVTRPGTQTTHTVEKRPPDGPTATWFETNKPETSTNLHRV